MGSTTKRLYGYAGKVLRVNLTNGEVKTEEIKEEVLRKFIGGVGYGAKVLYDEMQAGIDAFSPYSKLVFTTGPLTGTRAPGSGFAEVCCKSPLTNVWSESKCGGEWGGVLKKAGYDFIIIEGKAAEPRYIVIDNGEVAVKSAHTLRGKTTSQKDSLIKEALGDGDFVSAVIGPAGENLVRFGNIMVGGRAFGRCGAGAVMGSKNLLGIAVKGSGDIPVARPDRFNRVARDGNKKVLDATGGEGLAAGGTTGDIPACDMLGDVPTKNWRSNSWGKGEELYHHFETENLVTAAPCYKGCVLKCARIAGVKDGKWKTPQHEGSEYESICAFTFFVLNPDMDSAVHSTYLCNEYGMDTISAGALIAFALDCADSGMLSEKVDGLKLSWGNTDTVVELVHRIAKRQGIGRLLGEGTKLACKEIGKDSNRLAMIVKGLEGPAHDGRSGKALAVMYGTGNRGMCHIHPLEGMAYDSLGKDFSLIPFGLQDPKKVDRFAEQGKGAAAKLLQDFGILPDILGICKFYVYNGIGLADLADQLTALTGWEIDGHQLLEVGERVFNLQRMFNVREGIRRSDDQIPTRTRELPEFGKYASANECKIKDFDSMLDEYYIARDWDPKLGVPNEAKLQALGLTGC